MATSTNYQLFFAATLFLLASAAAKDITPQDVEEDAKEIYAKTADAVNIVAIVVGALLALFGYKYKRTTFFTIGFVGVGALVFLGVDTLSEDTKYQAWAPLVSMIVSGIVAGGLLAYFLKAGVFAVGAGLGVVSAMLLQTALFHRVSDDATTQQAILYTAMVLFGLILGALTLKLKRPLIVISTSYVGTFLATYGVGHFAGSLPSPFDLAADIDSTAAKGAGAVPTEWWIYCAAIAVFGTAAMMVQFKLTAKKDDKAAKAAAPAETNYLTLEAGSKQYGSTASEKPFAAHGSSLAYN